MNKAWAKLWRHYLVLNLICCLATAAPAAAAVNLAPLLLAPGTTVELDGGTLYSTAEVALVEDKTLRCNGAMIESTGGPIRISASGAILTVDDCVILGDGWALLGATQGGQLVVQNGTQLTGNGANSCIYIAGSSLEMVGGTIEHCRWGVNMENAEASLGGVNIFDTLHAIQNVAGHLELDGDSTLQSLDASNPGTGVSLIASPAYPSRGATAVIRDSTFNGFGNAVDIQPTAASGLPAGSVEIERSEFNAPYWSALAAVDAVNVRFVASRVDAAYTDGLYLVNSTGEIVDSEVVDSLNTGVTFWGCPDGIAIRNSLVSGSMHQGVAVVADGATGRASSGIAIVGNTFRDNVIADILVDAPSDALIQGNVFVGSPGASVRLHGSRSVDLVGDLFHEGYTGLEMKDGAYANGTLSVFARHDDNGALLYSNAMADFSHIAFRDNGLVTGDFSVFLNTVAQASIEFSSLGPAGSPGLYNNAGVTVSARDNYWDDLSGPTLTREIGGNGAILDWNPQNGSDVEFLPYLSASPHLAEVNPAFGLSADADTTWTADSGVTLSLTGRPGVGAVPNGLAAVLRVDNAATLSDPFPPAGTFADGVVTVWAEYDLLSRTASGSLSIQTSGEGEGAVLSRLRPDGCWAPVSTEWDSQAGEVVFAPVDSKLLSGIFVLGEALPDQETRARELISSYYWDILARDPEPGAEDSWYNGYFQYSIDLGIDVRFVFREMARVFFSSAEYAARDRTDEDFLRDNYQVFLRRIPSQAELDGWLNGEWNRAQAVSLFAESDEFARYIQGLFTCLEGIPTRNFVTSMYIGLLDRLVDEGGLVYFEQVFDTAFAQGGIEAVRDASRALGEDILNSDEYVASGPTSETHVVRLYRAYLGRFPSSSELGYWRDLLDNQLLTLDAMILEFSGSPEFTNRLSEFFGPG